MRKILLLATFFFFLFTKQTNAQIINEFVVDANPEWIEIYNSSDSADYLKDYWIDDDTDFVNDIGSSKKTMADINTDNVMYPYLELKSYVFNNSGDYVVLFDPLGNIVDQYQYSENPGAGVTIGRSPDGSGGFSILSSTTKGAANSPPVSNPTPTPAPTDPPTSAPTSTPTPTPTPSPTPSPTPKPTVKSASTRSASLKDDDEEGGEDLIMGLRDELKEEEEREEGEEEGKKGGIKIGSILLIIVGLGFIGLSGYTLYTQKQGKEEIENE